MPVAALLDLTATRPDGFISGVASSETIDAYGHLVKAGAFDASIRKRGISGPGGVKLLAFHDPQRPAGRISKLYTQNGELRIEAELNLDIGYVRDLHSAIRHSGGLSFSVGFTLDDFDLPDDPKRNEPWLIVKSGDLLEVSVVTFPACSDATMDFAKSMPVDASFEAIKARIASVQLTIASLMRNAHG